ncbi:hypothetical protein ACXYTJ_09765 [Gilvimarinus sp. F26214L]|uniref:hypothetical protein n=1 Tax=Gilvimarinus sp. DZF01 TaxID=3461371 RepID=UPI00404683AA
MNEAAKKDPTMDRARRVHWWVVVILHLLMAGELAVAVYNGYWMNVFLIGAIMSVIFIPLVLGRRFQLQIPSEFQILAVIFTFAALFLGEIRSYYERLWWWDIALHASSGLLLGVLGFLLVYVLNENERAALHMRPRFVALFAFAFAVTMGTLWEIFEFAMDELFGMNMQKPMLGDPSGLTDTMWDLMLDAVGAFVISGIGWWYMIREEHSFIERWIQKFIRRNPHLFRRLRE